MISDRLCRVRCTLRTTRASPASATIARLCTLLEGLPDAEFVDVELSRLETLVRVLRAEGQLSSIFLDVLADIQRVVDDAHAAYAWHKLGVLLEHSAC